MKSLECGDGMYMMVNSYGEICWISLVIQVHRGDICNCLLKIYYFDYFSPFLSYSFSG